MSKISPEDYGAIAVDEDGIVPITDQDWFKDDATNRFREFVQVVWGEEHLQEKPLILLPSHCLHAIKPKKSGISAGDDSPLFINPVLQRSSEDLQKTAYLLAI